MSTNYYLISKKKITPCHSCGSPNMFAETIHIGLSAIGWCFQLHYIAPNLKTLDDWKKLFYSDDYYIEDEYEARFNPDEMIDIITNRHGSPETRDFVSYGVILGPNNLLRDAGAIAYGDGTWDMIEGEFS